MAAKASSRKFGFASQPDGFAARFGIPSLHVLVLVGTHDLSGQHRRHDPVASPVTHSALPGFVSSTGQHDVPGFRKVQ